MNNKVSVLICTYNAEKYMANTLQSCINQTFTDFELLILDNHSTDKTLEIIKTFKDTRIQLFTGEKNLGPYSGLNFLLERATGEYIAIQDHDDLRHPQKIAKQIDFLEKHHEYVGCGTKTLMRYEGDQRGFEYFLGKKNYYTIHPSLVFRNAKHYRYPSTVYMADALFQKKTLCHGKKVIYNLDETLTMHRVRDETSNYSYKWYKLTCKNLKTVFSLHARWYAVFATLFELMRKIVYPVLHLVRCGYTRPPKESVKRNSLGCESYAGRLRKHKVGPRSIGGIIYDFQSGSAHLIDRIERLPFRLQGYKMRKYSINDMKKRGFTLS